jgi:hypothetical protein
MGEKLKYEVDTETASDYLNLFVHDNKGFRAKISDDYGKRNKVVNDNGFRVKKVGGFKLRLILEVLVDGEEGERDHDPVREQTPGVLQSHFRGLGRAEVPE